MSAYEPTATIQPIAVIIQDPKPIVCSKPIWYDPLDAMIEIKPEIIEWRCTTVANEKFLLDSFMGQYIAFLKGFGSNNIATIQSSLVQLKNYYEGLSDYQKGRLSSLVQQIEDQGFMTFQQDFSSGLGEAIIEAIVEPTVAIAVPFYEKVVEPTIEAVEDVGDALGDVGGAIGGAFDWAKQMAQMLPLIIIVVAISAIKR